MRQFAGFGSADDTNQRFKYLLKQGQTGLSVAFDLPTLMATEIDAARLLTRRAAAAKDAAKGGKGRYSMEAAIGKLFAAEMAQRVTTKALQIHGGYGYTKEYPVERNFRDARITEIYEGTSEIHRLIIAREIFKDAGLQIG